MIYQKFFLVCSAFVFSLCTTHFCLPNLPLLTVFIVFLYTCDTVSRAKYYKKGNIIIENIPCLRDYFLYSFTVGIDFCASAFSRILLHATRKIFYKRGWIKEQVPLEETMALLYLNSSLSLFYVEIKYLRIGNKRVKAGLFRATSFVVPSKKDHSYRKLIDKFEVLIDLNNKRALKCFLDDRQISMRHGLSLTFSLLVLYIHPRVHVHGGKLIYANDNREEFQDKKIIMAGINMAATLSTARAVRVDKPETVAGIMQSNCEAKLSHSRSKLNQLRKYSETLTFLLEAKKITREIHREFNLPLTAESIFTATVVHSMDHYQAGKILDEISLITDGSSPCNDLDWIQVTAVKPTFQWVVNTKLNKSTVAWHREFHNRLEKINKEFAAAIDWCIAY